MNPLRTFSLVLLAGVLAFLTACSIDIERNDDGSLTVTTTMTEESLSEELALALEDSHFENLTADLKDGYMLVSAERPRPDGSQVDQVNFRVDLGNNAGQLTATISEFTVNGQPGSEERLAQWNERIARRLERQAERHPHRTLESVTLTETDLTLVWHVVRPPRDQQGQGSS